MDLALKFTMSYQAKHEDKVNQILAALKPYTKNAKPRKYTDKKSNKRLYVVLEK